MNIRGQKINISSNIVKERTYSDSGWGYTETLSSVVTITIDGNQVENCGSTVLFAESGLKQDVNFQYEDIESTQSQLGDPICAYSGEEVYWEVCEDLPKTTMLTIDGKLLYIHRANFQIIDKELL